MLAALRATLIALLVFFMPMPTRPALYTPGLDDRDHVQSDEIRESPEDDAGKRASNPERVHDVPAQIRIGSPGKLCRQAGPRQAEQNTTHFVFN